MKSPILRVTLFCFAAVVFAAAIGYGSVKLYSQLQSGKANETTCRNKGADHLVVIKNGTLSPTHVEGHLCDTLTVTNTDDVLRYMAFGRHDEHVAYDGVSEKTVSKDQSFTITMNQAGNFKFHDHLHDEVAGTFTVN